MHRVLLLGAGKIGRAIAKLLAHSDSYVVTVADVNPDALSGLSSVPHVTTTELDVSDNDSLIAAMHGHDAVLSALSFAANPAVARAALKAGLSYFDLTEDVATTKAVAEVAAQAKSGQIFMPQCGLAPGFIAIAGHHVAQQFDTLDEVKLRVGALSKFPTGELKYNLTWSTDGLINEYCNPCDVIHDGKRMEVLPLEGLEHFSIDGVTYEAFNTSGGVGSLWETLHGRVRTLDYKTIRYRGHRDLISFLINELRLGERRHILKDIFEHAVPVTFQDVVLIFVTVTGTRKGRYTQITDARKIYHAEQFGEIWSAIQLTTAAGICTAVDLHFGGDLPNKGFIRQEQISLPQFLNNRFGQAYVSNHAPVSIES